MSFEIYVKCNACESTEVSLNPIKMRDDRLAIQGRCRDCGLKTFLGQNKSNNEWVMPFGKYKGQTIAAIADLDPDYCKWAADNLDEKIKVRFQKSINGEFV